MYLLIYKVYKEVIEQANLPRHLVQVFIRTFLKCSWLDHMKM